MDSINKQQDQELHYLLMLYLHHSFHLDPHQSPAEIADPVAAHLIAIEAAFAIAAFDFGFSDCAVTFADFSYSNFSLILSYLL